MGKARPLATLFKKWPFYKVMNEIWTAVWLSQPVRSAIAPLHSTFHVKTCIWQQLKPIMPVINVIKMSPCCNLLLLIRLLRASKWHFGKGTQSEKCLSWLHQHKSTFSAENTTTMWIVSQSMRAFSCFNFFLTLEPGIDVGPGKFAKNDKHRALNKRRALES